MIALFVVGSAILVWRGRCQTESQARRLGRVLAVLTAAIYGATLVYFSLPPTIGGSVPLRLTDLATVAAAVRCGPGRSGPTRSRTTGDSC